VAIAAVRIQIATALANVLVVLANITLVLVDVALVLVAVGPVVVQVAFVLTDVFFVMLDVQLLRFLCPGESGHRSGKQKREHTSVNERVNFHFVSPSFSVPRPVTECLEKHQWREKVPGSLARAWPRLS